ncbi:argininosuccinate lyase [bacterium]|nr:argininosuccinate lyase [bacterium]|tara:strand:+ start:11297 stop:12637 length:1341 start_codon:yes stop_codon:yes gene_type:complete
MKLWDKGVKTNKFIQQFTVGKDYLLDTQLVKYDCLASIAHAKILEKAGIISATESKKLKKEIKKIISLNKKGKFKVMSEQEDSHTAIENHLVKKIGVLGKNVHAGRSRNEQVVTMTRLYSKEKLLELEIETIVLCKQILSFAKKHEFVPMPGYTHTREAMPSSVGLWASSFVESLLDSIELLESAFVLNDQCPLGSAAGYGSNLPLSRTFGAKLLGFKKVQNNVLYVQNSRGKIEAVTVSALAQVMFDLSKAASDLILFSTPEFGFFELPVEICSGSSIMPQKRNPDVMELVRAKSKKVQANLFEILAIASAVGSSYHRDLQLTKQPLIDSFEETLGSVKAMQIVFGKLKVNKKDCIEACGFELFAADAALEMVKKGIPFREAYKKVAKNLDKLEAVDVLQNIKSKKMMGASGNLGLKKIGKEIAVKEKKVNVKEKDFDKAVAKLT